MVTGFGCIPFIRIDQNVVADSPDDSAEGTGERIEICQQMCISSRFKKIKVEISKFPA
jgi:hypothetical protein